MFEIKVTPQAAEDLLEIKFYIENDFLRKLESRNHCFQIFSMTKEKADLSLITNWWYFPSGF